jgi:predicted N-acyltransferase
VHNPAVIPTPTEPGDKPIEVSVERSMSRFGEAEWDALAGHDPPPFLRWAFLDALERTGCVGEATGWIPHHLALRRGGVLLGVVPGYLKGNSEGEFVFDYAWADLAERLGIPYYPKLLFAIPFTPATAPRLLALPEHKPLLLGVVAEAIRRIVGLTGVSSAHLLFPPEEDAQALANAGLMLRYGVQYHWHNRGYGTFDDFLGTFNSKRRHQLKRERKELDARGIRLETLRGKDLTPPVLDAMFGFYLSTVRKFYWGRRYLNRAFFEELGSKLGTGVEVVLAKEGDRALAGALNYYGGGALYGRYWGSDVDVPFLHFNVCYYHSIDECISRGASRFEPGAGGEHKKPRGFEPTLTHSLHHVQNPRFDRILRDHLAREREVVLGRVRDGEGDEE